MPAAIARLRADECTSLKFCTPRPKPMPMIGPISGEMSIAPIITAVELVFNPSDAMKIANISTTILVPLNDTPRFTSASISS